MYCLANDTTWKDSRLSFVFVAAKHSKIFPGVASESDLQKWRASKDRKSPSLSQMGPDSIKHKVSQIQRNAFARRSSTCAAFILFVSGDCYFNIHVQKIIDTIELGEIAYSKQSPLTGNYSVNYLMILDN